VYSNIIKISLERSHDITVHNKSQGWASNISIRSELTMPSRSGYDLEHRSEH
jgi:hypothetical protein